MMKNKKLLFGSVMITLIAALTSCSKDQQMVAPAKAPTTSTTNPSGTSNKVRLVNYGTGSVIPSSNSAGFFCALSGMCWGVVVTPNMTTKGEVSKEGKVSGDYELITTVDQPASLTIYGSNGPIEREITHLRQTVQDDGTRSVTFE